MSDPIHPEGVYACEGCARTYPEYVNGCVWCWDDDLTIEENRAKYPHRSVCLIDPFEACVAEAVRALDRLGLPPDSPGVDR